jgi:outer membrane lipoprotein-sorting protein
MSELGDLLELLHGASSRFERLHAVFRTWRHEEREEAAFAAYTEGAQITGTIHVAELDIDGDEADENSSPEVEGVVRIWLDGPDKLREEREDDDGFEITVRRGAKWWQRSEDAGVYTGEYDDEGIGTAADVQELSWLADPGRAVGVMDLQPSGHGQRAGRDVILVQARPLDAHRGSGLLEPFGEGADEYRFEVDAELGLILRLEARRDGLPFSIFEALSIEVDAPIPEERFTLEPPPGQRVRTMEEAFGRTELDIPLRRAARVASFQIFIPARVPRDWELMVTSMSAGETPDLPARVVLSYRSRDATASLMVMETSSDAPSLPAAGPGVPAFEDITRDGLHLRARERTTEWAQRELALVRDGTAISMFSSDLEVEALIAFALSLVPASDAPPGLA